MLDVRDGSTLVSPEWVARRLEDDQVRVIQVDEDPLLYQAGHVSGAGQLRWDTDLQSRRSRDVLSADEFATLMGRLGIAPETTVVFYGDRANGWAAYAFWVFRYWGHADVRLMDGGHAHWVREGRTLTREMPLFAPARYAEPLGTWPVRASAHDVLKSLHSGDETLIDARPRGQYGGAIFPTIGYPATGAHRGGHIPGAINVPWTELAGDDGCFKSPAELRRLYADAGVDLARPVIAYCALGIGSAFAYFALHELLGHDDVRNYDGSWMEWGSSVGYPVVVGDSPA